MKKKKVLIAVIIAIGLVLLFPIPQRLKDGGSIRYAALLYQITDVHRINPDIESEQPYLEGIEIEILGAKVFSNISAESGNEKLIYGDTSLSDGLGMSQDDIIIVPKVFKEPPELTIVCGEEQVTALKGTYSWEYSNGDGTSTGIEADSLHPLDSKEYMNELPLAYSYKSSVDSFKVHLQFEAAPDEVEIRYWDESCWNDYSVESEELIVQTLEVDYVDGGFSTDYIAKLLEGNYMYEVVAKWNRSENYGGTARYSFYTVMGDYEPVPIQE